LKNILFIGGSGLLALNWANQIKDNYQVFIGIHSKSILLAGVTSLNLTSDINELQNTIKKNNINIIVNCAGITNVELCELNPKLAYEVNSVLAKKVAIICENLGIKLVHISTDHLFKGNKELVNEDEIPNPLNIYGKSKLEGEFNVINKNPSVLIIRTNFFGWGTSYRKSFSDFILSELRAYKEIRLFDDVHYTPILIELLVIYVNQLIDKNLSGIFNVSGNERLSKFEFGEKLANQFDLNDKLIKRINFADRQDLIRRPLDLSLSNQKLVSVLDFKVESIDQQILRLRNQEKIGFCENLINL
jgi:dTDP-4-dehydrorhamnose reductase